MTTFNTPDEFADWLEENDHNNSQGVPLLYPDEVYIAYVTIQGLYADDPDDYISDAEEAYVGEFDSDIEFAYDMAESLNGDISGQGWPFYRIDWAAAAEDLMMDYTEQDRYYFRNI